MFTTKKLVLEYMNNLKDQYSIFYQIYPFSTENLTEFFTRDLFYQKNVLLTGSSADQLLTAQLFQANKITCYDINPFVKLMYDLKVAAIKTLKRDEFIEFFYYHYSNESSFEFETYKKIRVQLSGESLDCWDTLYDSFLSSEIRKRLFLTGEIEENKNRYKQIIPYLTEDNYEELKRKTNFCEIEFLECDVMNLAKELSDCYDTIYFSNIFSRLEMIHVYDGHYIKRLYNFMKQILNHTKDTGNIILGYFYSHPMCDFYNSTACWTHHVRFPIRYFKCQNNILYKEVSTVGVDNKEKSDTVLIYTKR